MSGPRSALGLSASEREALERCEHECGDHGDGEPWPSDVRTLIAILRRLAPAEGMVSVPRSPSDAMLEAGAVAYETSTFNDLIGPLSEAYRAMIAAHEAGK